MNFDERFPCPCCGYLTMDELGGNTYDICPICYWEDDEFQNENPNFSGGANKVCLNEARENFKKIRVSSKEFSGLVRAPYPDEIPGDNLTDEP